MRKEEGTVKDVLAYRLRQADDSIVSAKALMHVQQLSGALNRIYYSMFYVVAALALVRGYKTSRHQQLIGWFNREFVHTGVVTLKMGKIIHNAFDARMESDYEPMVLLGVDEITDMLSDAEEFVETVRGLISD